MKRSKYIEIDSQSELSKLLNTTKEISHHVFQALDFRNIDISNYKFSDNIFLGCSVSQTLLDSYGLENVFIPILEGVPYNSFINELYDKNSLLGGYELGNPESYNNSLDKRVYDHYISTGKESDSIHETLARRLHDHAITDAMFELIGEWDEKRIIAVMGGHSLPRDNANFETVVRLSKALTEDGYLMISGGGPGAMEATHVGAWLAGKSDDLVSEFISVLSEAPSYKDKLWLDKAFQLISKYPDVQFQSLGIPTWLYGHEPPTPFATKIAKYFANSVREDGLLAIAKGGVIFAPGSAGTIQEIFQDATQNHYLSFGYASPMVFLNEDYWTTERPIYPLLKKMTEDGKYKNLILSVGDTHAEIANSIKSFTDN